MDHNEAIKAESTKLPASPAPPPAPAIPPHEEAQDEAFFSPTNVVILGMLATLIFYLLYKFHLEELWNIGKAVLGLSFVIFIHELGHFLAAKWSDVHVTTFSIGFGPPIPGCHFTWGETTYKFAIIPLGGYVQMVGQVDGDESSDGNEDDPRSYRRKTVGQRMLIISAGVLMNALLAVACFITVYMGPGKEHAAANIYLVDTAAPAHDHGLRTGAKITQFGDRTEPTFTHLMQIVINSAENEKIKIKYQRTANGPEFETELEGILQEETSDRPPRPVIGVASPPRLQLAARRESRDGPFYAGTPAASAGFEFGDVIVATTDPDDPAQLKEYRSERMKDLSPDWRLPKDLRDKGPPDYFEFFQRMQLLADKEIKIKVKRKLEEKTEYAVLTLAPRYRLDLGARMQMGPILAVRQGSPAFDGVLGPRPGKTVPKLRGDIIEAVLVKDARGQALMYSTKDGTLDPERLPFQLRAWSDGLIKAGARADDKKDPRWLVKLTLSRHPDSAGADGESIEKELRWDADWRFDNVFPNSASAPMPIPELGLAYQIKAAVIKVTRLDSPLKEGDVIKNLRFDYEGFEEEIPAFREALFTLAPFLRPEPTTVQQVKWMNDDLKEGQWAAISANLFQRPLQFKKLVIKIERNKKIEEVEVPIKLDESWPIPERGWVLARDSRRVKADGPLQAVGMGFSDTHDRMMEVFQNLRGMLTGRISFKNLGGPITIARATYIFAGMDFGEFMFFLGLISINLAVVNFLPIPVLDGGHMVFLIYEKLRGQPASEGVRIAATYVGLAMIACLMLFVLYLDVTRLFL